MLFFVVLYSTNRRLNQDIAAKRWCPYCVEKLFRDVRVRQFTDGRLEERLACNINAPFKYSTSCSSEIPAVTRRTMMVIGSASCTVTYSMLADHLADETAGQDFTILVRKPNAMYGTAW
jgi:hypothetical protein